MKNEVNTEIIDNYLKENKLSKTKFCKVCGISRGTLEKVMKNENVRITVLFKIARVLNVPIHQLFREE